MQHGVEAVLVGEDFGVGHGGLTGGDGGVEFGEVPTRGQQFIESRARGVAGELLRQVGDFCAALEGDAARIGGLVSGQGAEEGALARPARTDEADLLAILQRPREAAKDGAAAMDAGHVVEVGDDHPLIVGQRGDARHSPPRGVPGGNFGDRRFYTVSTA